MADSWGRSREEGWEVGILSGEIKEVVNNAMACTNPPSIPDPPKQYVYSEIAGRVTGSVNQDSAIQARERMKCIDAFWFAATTADWVTLCDNAEDL